MINKRCNPTILIWLKEIFYSFKIKKSHEEAWAKVHCILSYGRGVSVGLACLASVRASASASIPSVLAMAPESAWLATGKRKGEGRVAIVSGKRKKELWIAT